MQRQFTEITRRYLFFHHMRNLPLSPYAVYRDERFFLEKLYFALQDGSLMRQRNAALEGHPDYRVLATLRDVMAQINKNRQADDNGVIHAAFQADADRFASVYFMIDYYSQFPSQTIVPLAEIEACWRGMGAEKRRDYVALARRNQKHFEDYVNLYEKTGKVLPKSSTRLQSVLQVAKPTNSTVSNARVAEESIGSKNIEGTSGPCPFQSFENLVQEVFANIGSDVEEALRQVAAAVPKPASKQISRRKGTKKQLKKKALKVKKSPVRGKNQSSKKLGGKRPVKKHPGRKASKAVGKRN